MPELTAAAPFEVHPFGDFNRRPGVMLSFTVGVPQANHASVLDIHRLLLNDDNGLGMVAYLSTQASALYHWPQRDRGSRSLVAFLSGCSLHYVAGKFNLDNDFDEEATEKRVKEAVEGEFSADRARDIMHDYSGSSREDFQAWVASCAPNTARRPAYERFTEVTRVNPFFASFWMVAKPWLRDHAAEIEARLYPHGELHPAGG